MYKTITFGASAAALLLMSGGAFAEDGVYGGFPITVQNYAGKKTDSVSYSGQIARHILHDSLKKLAGKGNGKPNAALRAQMLSYYRTKDRGRSIIAPRSKGPFEIKQSGVDQISKGKNLSGKTFKGAIAGMPNNMTGPELVVFWINKASMAKKGVDIANGYNYPQLISKFIMGAVSYNQAVDNYLDEKLSATKKPNDKPYKKGAAYTGKEHSWDEAFGYFGAPAHTMKLSAKQVYEIAKQGKKSKPPSAAQKFADYNSDGVVDLKTEMTFGPAYYAAAFDKGGKTKYLHKITGAFLAGRNLLAQAKGKKLSDKERAKLRAYAATVATNWEAVLAEATFKYAGSVYRDMSKIKTILDAKGDTSKTLKSYIKHWGELKGFSLALQTGQKNLGDTATRLNRLIGFGPLMPNLSQVTDLDSSGHYVRNQGVSWGEYMLHMVKVQKLLADKFKIKAKLKDESKKLAELTKSLGGGSSAEND